MTANRFETWFKGQLEKDLVDIKFAVTPGKNVSVESIKQELLTSEANISMGNVNKAPTAMSEIPDGALAIMKRAFA